MQEHALFHSREVVVGAALILGVSYGISRYTRRRHRARGERMTNRITIAVVAPGASSCD